MNPESADAWQKAFLEFEKGECAAVAVYSDEGGAFCTGLDLKHTAVLEGDNLLGGLDFPENLRMEIQPEEQLGQVDCN